MSSNGKVLSKGKKRAAKPKTKRVVITQTTTAAPQQRKRVRARRKKASVAVSSPGKVSGQGAYFGDLGASAGSYLGKRAGGFLDTVFGLGDYKVRRNSLVNPGSVVVNANTPPRVVNAKKGEATVVNHREYIGDLSSGAFIPSTTSTEFSLLRYQINPGNTTLFPWLSSQADGYQEYEVHGMLVELVTEASEVSTNLSMGIMAMAAEYNPLAPSPVSKLEMLELEYASSCKTSQTLIMPIECARAYDGLTHLLVDVDEDYDGYDARNFDLGAIFIASVGQPAEHAKIAEIWVTYEMWFYKPRLPRGIATAAFHAQLFNASTADPLNNFLVMPGSMDGFYASSDGTGYCELNFPPGARNWFVYFWWIENSLATTDAFELSTDGGSIVLTMFSNQAGNDADAFVFADTASTASPNRLMQACIFSASSLTPRITLVGGGLITGALGDVFAFALPPNLLTSKRSLSTMAGQIATGRLNTHSNRMSLVPPPRAVDTNFVRRRAAAAKLAPKRADGVQSTERKTPDTTRPSDSTKQITRSMKRKSSEALLLQRFLDRDDDALELLLEIEKARADRACRESGLYSSEEDGKSETK